MHHTFSKTVVCTIQHVYSQIDSEFVLKELFETTALCPESCGQWRRDVKHFLDPTPRDVHAAPSLIEIARLTAEARN